MAAPIGIPAGGRPINLAQLQAELAAQGVADSLGMADDWIYTYDAEGAPADFAPQDMSTVQRAINDHVGMRNKTTDEYSVEFQDPNTPVPRKQEIRDITAGLLPAEQVPMT